MRPIARFVASLLLSVFLAVGGMYGCSMHEWSRQGQPQDGITHTFAALAYLGLLGALGSVAWLVFALFEPNPKRRG